MALKNISHQRFRSFLTLLGIVIGIAAIVALTSMGEGLNAAVQQQFESIGMDVIAVEPGGSFMETAFSKMREADIKVIENIPGVEAVAGLYEGAATIKFGKKEASLFVIGIEPSKSKYFEASGYIVLSRGRLLTNADTLALLVTERFAREAFDEPIGLGQRLEVKGKTFKIVGILKDSDVMFGSTGGLNMAWAPDKTVKEVFDEPNPTEIVVKVFDKSLVNDVAAKIEKRLEKKHGQKDFTVYTTENLIETVGKILDMVELVLVGIAAIALLVGGIGIMNTMLMAVMERTREIGVMKAIGATNAQILGIFLSEAAIIGMIGGAIGAIVGSGFAFAVGIAARGMGFPLPITVNVFVIAAAIAFAMLVGIVSGLLPARAAARLDPVEALRY